MSDYYQNNGAGGYSTQSPVGSQGSPGGRGDQREQMGALRPVTASMVKNAVQAHGDTDFTIGNVPLGHVTFVGKAVSINGGATNMTYWLDDGTGRVEARVWVDSAKVTEGEEQSIEGVSEGKYLRLNGQLKQFGTKRYINATHVRPVENDIEVYFHAAEVMTVTTVLERGMPSSKNPPGQFRGSASVNGVSGGAGPSAYMTQGPSVTSDNNRFGHLDPLSRQIMEFMVSQPDTEEGIHVAAIARAVGGDGITISSAVDKLMDDGMMFSTFDESHFKLAE